MATAVAGLGALVVVLVAVSEAAIDPAYAINMTVYHVNEKNYTAGDVTNMNTADVFGDLYFDLRTFPACPTHAARRLCRFSHRDGDDSEVTSPLECAIDPFSMDCNNPEATNTSDLAITEVILEVDSRFTNYSRCNDVHGVYNCVCYPNETCDERVGREDVAAGHKPEIPAQGYTWQWWKYNLAQYLGGNWFSTVATGRCNSTNEAAPCYWRVVEVHKRISKTCSDKHMAAYVTQLSPRCFDNCPQPTNQTSSCWIGCFFDTLMGPQSASTYYNPTQAVPKNNLSWAFRQPFISDNIHDFGCPAI
ncbi:uncharacterized protein MONBRDRAFT_25531 [Monosiga brevicollis MX1]|uniref:Uncharacterized protein n=1 Tax=Monosiga brevicollis TaxID=81824 RepID=A9UZP5_MONBE|nr:uncharacterized protein MONBRDRAFT_25531 [Monosiga brevicollis MX1]EDQ89268.1 predicted protein [Monosiga brevicollis MX1]|eukprot:XP_001745844.1 hypothetical protein [Monosiga brevicollis MX1]